MYRDMDDVKRKNREIGHHFFDPGTLRWFQSRIGGTLYGGRYFVTSEQDSGVYVRGQHHAAWGGQRRYTVREAMPDGTIDTLPNDDPDAFGRYATRSEAVAAIRRLLKEE